MRSHRVVSTIAALAGGATGPARAGATHHASPRHLQRHECCVVSARRFKSSTPASRFTRTGHALDKPTGSAVGTSSSSSDRPSGNAAGPLPDATHSATHAEISADRLLDFPLTRVKQVTPIRSVAELHAAMTQIRSEMRQLGQRGTAPTAQGMENRRRHHLRQLLSFSLSVLPPQEQLTFSIGALAKILQTLDCFPCSRVAWQETGLVRELAQWLENDISRSLAHMQVNQRRPSSGAERTAAAAQEALPKGDQASLLFEQYVTCAQQLCARLGAHDMEEVALLLLPLIQQAMETADNGETPGVLAVRDTTLDAYLSLVLAVLADNLGSSSQTECVSSQLVNVKAFSHEDLFVAAKELGRRLLARIEDKSAGFIQEQLLVDMLLSLGALTGVPVRQVNGHTERAGTDAGLDVVRAAQARGKAFVTSPQWQRLATALLARLPTCASLPTERTIDLLRVAINFQRFLREDTAKITVKGAINQLVDRVLDAHAGNAVTPVDLWELTELGAQDSAVATRVAARTGGDTRAVQASVTAFVASVLERSGGEVSVDQAAEWLQRVVPTADTNDAAGANALTASLHTLVARIRAEPNLIHAISPPTMQLLFCVMTDEADRVLLRNAYYEHLKEQFNHGQKVFPADVACLFTETNLGSGWTGPNDSRHFVQELGFAVQANLRKWTIPEVFVFVRTLARFSVRAAKEAARRPDAAAGADAAVLALAHQEANAILRECARFLAPFIKDRETHPKTDHSPEPEEVEEGGSASHRVGTTRQPRKTSRKSPSPAAASPRFTFSLSEALVLLQSFAACGVRHDDFVEHASERFAAAFRAMASSPPAGSPHGVSARDGFRLEPIGNQTQARFLIGDLRTIADVLSCLAMLEAHNNKAFLDAAPVIVEALRKGGGRSAAVTPDTVTRLLASFSVMLVWHSPLVCALSEAVRHHVEGFTLEQLTVVQHALIRVNARDKGLSQLYVDAVEQQVLGGNDGATGHTSPLERFQRDVGLLSALSRVAFCFHEDVQERGTLQNPLSVSPTDTAARSVGSVNCVVNSYDHFAYQPLPADAFLTHAQSVCRGIADRILANLDGVCGATGHSEADDASAQVGPSNRDMSSDLVAELMISLARVHLFAHPLFETLKQESLSAVLHVNSSLCLSQMVRAVALAAVTDQQERASASAEGETARSPPSPSAYYDEFFSLAIDETLKLVKQQQLSAAMLSHVLFSVTIAGHRDDKLFITVLPKVKLLALYGTFDEISETLFSFAKNNIWHQRLFAKLADRLVDLIKKENILHKPQLLLTLESLASVRFRYDKLFDLVATRILSVMHLCSFPDICRLVRCFSVLNYHASPSTTASARSSGEARHKDERQGDAAKASTSTRPRGSGTVAGRSVYDALYTSCADRAVDLLRQEKQHQRQAMLCHSEHLKHSIRAFLRDLANAGVRHDSLLRELEEVFPDLSEEFQRLQL